MSEVQGLEGFMEGIEDDLNGVDEKSERRIKKIEKEKSDLLAQLASGNFSTVKTRVAFVLNLFPQTRNSDVALALKYWEEFQPDIYHPDAIAPRDLFKLERFHYLVRARAKIQNEYGLFVADEEVRKHRRHREEDMHDAVLGDNNPRRIAFVFADETGKNDKYVIVASIWVLRAPEIYKISRAIKEWQNVSPWSKREVHFSKFGRADINVLEEYLRVVNDHREYLSFKAVAFEKAKARRDIESIVMKLHEHMLVKGVEHEIEKGRIALPRALDYTVDEEDSLDAFHLADMKGRVADEFARLHGDQLSIDNLQSASSENSQLIQLADVLAGAINRRMNYGGEPGHKDVMSDMVLQSLDIELQQGPVEGLDASALFYV